jgi:hypothetical protein
MKKARPFLIVWVLGVVAGVVMIERWRRTGAFDLAAPSPGDATDGAAATPAGPVPADKPTAAAAIMVGAKADADQARRMFGQLMRGGRPAGAPITKLWRSGPAATPPSPPPAATPPAATPPSTPAPPA